jgi:glycerophosphoryl diester phosphodiesterase
VTKTAATARQTPRIIAHRCGGALAPENSLAGLRIAARLGCRGVEFDVMLSADGVPLLIHDETLERTTTGRGRVCELTAAQIRAFDAGAPHHPAFAVSPAPTLAEAMAVCDELGLWTNIELKPAAGREAQTGEVVGAWLGRHWNGHGVVSSFSPAALAAARRQNPESPFAMLCEALPQDWRKTVQALDCSRVHLAAENLTPDATASLGGFPWAAYTVNSVGEAERLFRLGCSGIFTDRPDLWPVGEM